MYLVGYFQRDYWGLDEDDSPMRVKLKSDITKDDLLRVKNDGNYQVINLLTKEFFEPRKNKWIKINWFE